MSHWRDYTPPRYLAVFLAAFFAVFAGIGLLICGFWGLVVYLIVKLTGGH